MRRMLDSFAYSSSETVLYYDNAVDLLVDGLGRGAAVFSGIIDPALAEILADAMTPSLVRLHPVFKRAHQPSQRELFMSMRPIADALAEFSLYEPSLCEPVAVAEGRLLHRLRDIHDELPAWSASVPSGCVPGGWGFVPPGRQEIVLRRMSELPHVWWPRDFESLRDFGFCLAVAGTLRDRLDPTTKLADLLNEYPGRWNEGVSDILEAVGDFSGYRVWSLLDRLETTSRFVAARAIALCPVPTPMSSLLEALESLRRVA